ncbi:MAG: hypothetical protein FRX49_04942 [Trebouxia sp. A1-2]|nr:MAG: hypothetical protein FRX49_04942 [Trebouxia sp. A1-2]
MPAVMRRCIAKTEQMGAHMHATMVEDHGHGAPVGDLPIEAGDLSLDQTRRHPARPSLHWRRPHAPQLQLLRQLPSQARSDPAAALRTEAQGGDSTETGSRSLGVQEGSAASD